MIKYIIHKYQITRIRYKFARAGLYLKECKSKEIMNCVTCNEALDQKFHCVNSICVEYFEEVK